MDESDNQIGVMDKLEAHKSGSLHRAFSVFVFNSGGKLLLQKRADSKYHSGGLWSNTCCGHPSNGESTVNSARRRLMEEMGLDCDLDPLFSFTYKCDVGDGLSEHEIDHVFIGYSDDEPHTDPNEASACKFESFERIIHDLNTHPETYTTWFHAALPILLEKLDKQV